MTALVLHNITLDPDGHTAIFTRTGEDRYQAGDLLLEVFQLVVSDTDPATKVLEDIFELLNGPKPEGYTFRSLSAGDVVVLLNPDRNEAYFCAPLGWTEIGHPFTYLTANPRSSSGWPPLQMHLDPTVNLRVADAAAAGLDAFWDKVAESYADRGDQLLGTIPPSIEQTLIKAAFDAIEAWVSNLSAARQKVTEMATITHLVRDNDLDRTEGRFADARDDS